LKSYGGNILKVSNSETWNLDEDAIDHFVWKCPCGNYFETCHAKAIFCSISCLMQSKENTSKLLDERMKIIGEMSKIKPVLIA
jgi:hypothetical protein